MEEQVSSSQYRQCIHCEADIAITSRFCNHCGSLQVEESAETHAGKWVIIKQLALFYTIEALICSFFNLTDFHKTVPMLLGVDVAFAILGIIFFSINWADSKTLLRWHSFSFQKLCLYCAIAFSAALVVHYMVTWLNHTMFNKEVYYYFFFMGSRYSKLIMVFFIAVVPALFEELSYRGYVLQSLLKVVDNRQAIFVSAFMFAAIHISMLSLFWLIPFALLLGYVRVKEKTLWYGVAIHFCFNLTPCLMDIMAK